MSLILNKRRSYSNIFGILLTSAALGLCISSLVFFFLKFYKLFYILFFASAIVNYLITLCVAVSLINFNKRSDLFIILYLLVFLLFPYIGVFIYFLLGFDSIHIFSENNRKFIEDRRNNTDELTSVRTFNYNRIKHKIPIYSGVNVVILDSAIQILKEITNLIESAKHFIFMEFYLFCDGLVFDHIFELFKKKKSQNVEIKLIIDDIGSRGRLSWSSIKKLRKIGVEVYIFNPLFRNSDLWWQFRNHNKILIIDNEYALMGSCNIADEYFNIARKYFQTTEFSIKLSGEIVNSCTSMFLEHWNLCVKKKSKKIEDFGSYLRKIDNLGHGSKSVVQFVNNSPMEDELIIRDNLVQLIFNAKKSIVISTPYFYPPKDLINALKQASVSGVSVKILVPKNPDLINFFRTLNRQLFYFLLNQNIEIYEYFGFNHEKLMIVDDEIVYCGSYNWDYRALYLNFETALLIQCRHVALSVSQFMDRQFKNSHRIYHSDLKTPKNLIYLFFSMFIRIFKPFL